METRGFRVATTRFKKCFHKPS